MKRVVPVIVSGVLLSVACAQDAVEFNVPKTGRVSVTNPTPAFFEEVAAVAEKTPMVRVEKEATQVAVTALSALTWVEEIELQSNLATDISALASMKNLRKVRLHSMDAAKDTPIDLAPLAGLEKLESLDGYATEIGDTSGLANKPHLKVVKLYMAGVDSLEFLNTSPNVEELNLYGFKHSFPDYTPVAGLTKLRELNIYMNKQAVDEKLAVLSALTTLEEISMSNCKEVTTLDFLANSKGMKEIRALWCAKLEDLSALEEMTEMERLDLERCVAKDFSFLSGLTKLKSLNLEETSFTDLSLLPEGAPLSSLDLEDCEITSLEELKRFPTLRRLKLKGTKVTDLSPLAALKHLNSLELDKEFPEAEKAKLMEALPDLRIR